MANYEAIREAILNKKQVWANYNAYYRKMCPHAIVLINGKKLCLFYQFEGESRTGLSLDGSKNWRSLPIDTLGNVTIHEGEWHSSSSYKQNYEQLRDIDIAISA